METEKLEQLKKQIENEMNETVEIKKVYDDFLIFDCDQNRQFSAKFTKAKKYRKNSIRLWIY